MKIAVIHLGDFTECFIASSINKGLSTKFDNPEIKWIVKDEYCTQIFKYNKQIDCITIADFVTTLPQSCDMLINLDYKFNDLNADLLATSTKIGCNYGGDDFYKDMYFNNKDVDLSLFQIYYRLAGMRWEGEGFDLAYYPRNRTKKNRLGVAIADSNLREYVNNNIFSAQFKKWYVPNKKNIFKKLDELNRCSCIVTDDFLTLHLSLYLRKYVHYLQKIPLNFNVEFFGKGEHYRVPVDIIR